MPSESLARIGRVLAGLVLASLVGAAADKPAPLDAGHWRQVFARPDHAPMPADNPAAPEKIALGAKLFEDTRLSGSGDMACSSCHQADLSFSDGVDRHLGHDGQPLDRRTPPLWNLAWGLSFFWDGRASSLEAQAMVPIENEREMAGNLQKALRALGSDPQMRKDFAAAFPDDPAVTQANLAKALAAFQRTLVSPETRFDRWVKGDDTALEANELAGFSLFVGKAGCVACHQGWRFTDEAFHDIGLPGDDKGRGPVIGVSAANHAFKTPSLRERVWSAPYMHDGSLATFDDVVAHYADHVVQRPTLSADLPRPIELNDEERAQLVAFLATLSSDDPPRPANLPSKAMSWGTDEKAIPTSTVSQKDKRFTPGAILLKVGEALRIVNDDTRVHNVRLDGPGKSFNSDGQNPGDTVTIGFDGSGHYDVICGIHPEMRLSVEVAQVR
ncbi:cytochrome c peroxidase [Microvirga lotononidis]|uniref:Cytochrome c peroxidase n=1 Tax=Microvirga lotononidis TaxID=864069 RepID=I4YPT0_9HYPH|nr:cytochrome c peroxidase [Microvirga lotononidis]EIM25972.1 cytochrome c peroxidase [Microvirga lotononidis]WQO25884.1 cytochrome c peroxidase [Microvirga lotononidis]